MGDCNFPHIKEVRDKYPLPLCEDDEEQEYFKSEEYKEKIKEILEIVSKHNIKNNNE